MRFFTRVDREMSTADGRRLIGFTCFLSLAMLVCVPISMAYTGETLTELWDNFTFILGSPSKLVTDYFMIGSLAAAFLNAALCGIACNIIMLATRVRPTSSILAGYFLVVAHCFYGLNIINMWPPFLGVMLFCYVEKEKLGPSLHLAMFSTALAPFVSDLLYRYAHGTNYVVGMISFTVQDVVLAIGFGLLAGFLVPSLLPGTTKMHRGHNLYKAGLAIGLFGMFAYAFFYKTFGVESPDAISINNALYESYGKSYILFVDVFIGVILLIVLLYGFFLNGRSFKGYSGIWKCNSLDQNFPRDYGMPLTFINIGLYGLFILAYYNVVVILTSSLNLPGSDTAVGFTGATAGVIIAAMTFAAGGQTIRNVWPIALGYTIVYFAVSLISAFFATPMTWSLATQGYINGFAFATGLCPFSGEYGWKVGVVAGMLHAVLCTSTVSMHGGFVLYNGGLTSGLTALIMLPVLEFYKVKSLPEKEEGE